MINTFQRIAPRLNEVSRQVLQSGLQEPTDAPPRGPLPQKESGRHRSRRAVRQASILFVAAGVIGFASDLLPGGIDDRTTSALILDAANLAVGLVCWITLTGRLPGFRSLSLAVFAMADIATNNVLGFIPSPTLGIWFVVVFAWIGAWHPPRLSLAMAPVAIGAYLVPFAFGAPRPSGAIASAILVVPAAVLVGLTIATNATTAQRASREQRRALGALAVANVTDDLTTLGNRRFGNELLDGLHAGDVIALLDLDNFKRVNDEFGHSEGDHVLQELGMFLSSFADDGVHIARMGGEEFMLVFSQSRLAFVTAKTNEIVDSWRATEPLSTLSAGIASHREGASPSHTYHLADQALYGAKAQGRDQVVATCQD